MLLFYCEIFGKKYGVLRIDISTEYEKLQFIEEILRLAIYQFVPDFEIENLEIKAENTPNRIPLLKNMDLFLPIRSEKDWNIMRSHMRR